MSPKPDSMQHELRSQNIWKSAFFLNTTTSDNKAGFAVPLRAAFFLLTARPAAFIRAAQSLRVESRAVHGHWMEENRCVLSKGVTKHWKTFFSSFFLFLRLHASMLSILIKGLIQEGKLLWHFVQIVLRCMHALPEGHELTVNKLQGFSLKKTNKTELCFKVLSYQSKAGESMSIYGRRSSL